MGVFRISSILLLLTAVVSCQNDAPPEDKLQLNSRRILENLPSASGIEILNENVFVISDNTPWLYELDENFKIKDTLLIAPKHNLKGEVFEKNTKFDFEGIASFYLDGNLNVFIFGSGSKSDPRNKLVWLKRGKSTSTEVYDLSSFYRNIIDKNDLDEGDMNLEGVSVVDDQLYLFNRGNNSIWKFELKEFIEYLIDGVDFPKFNTFNVILPIHANVKAGFSGASELEDESQIIFTSSLEDTDNWVDDGEVLGSYIGLIDLNELKNNYRPLYFPLQCEGEMLKLKMESVAVKAKEGDIYHLLMVTDSDGGNSELIEAEMGFK